MTVTLAEAQTKLAELIDRLADGGEVVITRDDRPVAKLVAAPAPRRGGFGAGKGSLTINADDDEHLKDFAEYMPRP